MDVQQRARELYQKGEMHDALEAAQAACERHPKDAEAWWLLGCVARYVDMPGASDDAFRRASELARRRRLPQRVTPARFEELVLGARQGLSPDALRRLSGTQIRVEPLPALDLIRAGLSPDALHSRSRGAEDVLSIYQVNHENRAASEADLQVRLARTLSRA
jgi:hypothetical protein